jgi:hypothetical protein
MKHLEDLEQEEYETRELIFRIQFNYDFDETAYEERSLMFKLGRHFKGTRSELDKTLSLLTENQFIKVKNIDTYNDAYDYIVKKDFVVETKSTIKTRENVQRKEALRYLKSSYNG